MFDLVEPREDKFRTAFYHVLGDTIYADDMRQAQRIAFGAKRFRVVTANGEMIETTGVMSGGGSNPIRGKMGSVRRSEAGEAEVKALESNLKKLNEKYRYVPCKICPHSLGKTSSQFSFQRACSAEERG